MKFRNKVFWSLLLLSGFLVTVTLSVNYARQVEAVTKEFDAKYQEKMQGLADTFMQLETAADRIGENAAKALIEIDGNKGLLKSPDYENLKSHLNVSNIFVTDRNGRFIISTNGDPATFENGLFDYCADYKNLIFGQADIFLTPMIPSADEAVPGPYKYIMVPNKHRSRVLEVSINLTFITELLKKTIESDHYISHMKFYTPTGGLLGETAPRSHAGETKTFKYQIFPAIGQCCECQTKAIAGADGRYNYTLEASVSMVPLMALKRSLLQELIISLFLSLIAAYLISMQLSKILVQRLEMITEFSQSYSMTDSDHAALPVQGTDEVTTLSEAINKMIVRLRENQRIIIRAESDKRISDLARKVAHDIRSPLSAFEMGMRMLDNVKPEIKSLLEGAIRRINTIANDLLADSKKTDVPSIAVLPLIEELVNLKRLETKAEIRLICNTRSQQGRAYAVPEKLDRIISNVINNSIEASVSAKSTEPICVKLEILESHVVIMIMDNGTGIPPEVLTRLGREEVESHKANGNGIALFAAVKEISEWGGSLNIQSAESVGTIVQITLRRAIAEDVITA